MPSLTMTNCHPGPSHLAQERRSRLDNRENLHRGIETKWIPGPIRRSTRPRRALDERTSATPLGTRSRAKADQPSTLHGYEANPEPVSSASDDRYSNQQAKEKSTGRA